MTPDRRRESTTIHIPKQPMGRDTMFRSRIFLPESGDDLFAREQKIYDEALKHAEALADGARHDPELFKNLAREYGRMLKYLRRATKQADLTTRDLHMGNLDLLDKAFYDAVTGIYNRQFLDKMLGQIMRGATRAGDTLSVLMIDIDFFKKYNDTRGHAEGDKCLRAVAQTLHSSSSRDNDFVARYGGEEFVVVLPGANSTGARVVAENTMRAVRNLQIPHSTGADRPFLTISVGATTIGAVRQDVTATDIIRRADEALYESKRNGRDKFTHHEFTA